MSNLRHILSNLLAVVAGLLVVAAALLVALLTAGEHLRPLWLRFISESDPVAGPPQEAFDRFRREQDDIASGADRGPMRCFLSPWPEGIGEPPPDVGVLFKNESKEPVTFWYPTSLLSHVTFLMRDEQGKPVKSLHWGTLSSQPVSVDPITGRPTTTLPTRTLKGGEHFAIGINSSVLREYLDVPPGRYNIEAVFVYHDLGGWPAPNQDFVARSGAVEIEVIETDAAGKERSWQLARLIRKKGQAAAEK